VTPQEISENFRQRGIRADSGCLEWRFNKNPDGYGRVYLSRGKYMLAHRASWVIANGSIPQGLNVCHRCDSRACVEVSHLFLGTQLENIADTISKNRHHKLGSMKFGSENPAAKLTEDQVREIRRSVGSPAKIGQRFHIDRTTVHAIRTLKTWRHVQ